MQFAAVTGRRNVRQCLPPIIAVISIHPRWRPRRRCLATSGDETDSNAPSCSHASTATNPPFESSTANASIPMPSESNADPHDVTSNAPLRPTPAPRPKLLSVLEAVRSHPQLPPSFEPCDILNAADLLDAARAAPNFAPSGDAAATALAIARATLDACARRDTPAVAADARRAPSISALPPSSSSYAVPLLIGLNAAFVVVMLAFFMRSAIDAGALAPLAMQPCGYSRRIGFRGTNRRMLHRVSIEANTSLV